MGFVNVASVLDICSSDVQPPSPKPLKISLALEEGSVISQVSLLRVWCETVNPLPGSIPRVCASGSQPECYDIKEGTQVQGTQVHGGRAPGYLLKFSPVPVGGWAGRRSSRWTGLDGGGDAKSALQLKVT